MSIPAINAEIIACKDESSWLAERRKRVQASDGSRIIVENERYPVYAEKVSPPLVTDRLEWQELKLESESTVRKVYQKKYGGKVHAWPAYTIAVSKEHSWLGCTPDSLVEDSARPGIGIQQIKCWSEFDRKSWLESPPLYVQVQTQIEMLVCGVKWGVIAVMFGTNSLERFYIEPNESFVAAMLPLLRDFWTCVELRTPPEMDGSEATTKALSRLHPNDNGKAVHLPPGSDDLLFKLERAEGLAKKLKSRADSIKNQLRAAIGENTYGETLNGSWLSWKSQTRKSYTVSESTSRVFRKCKEPHLIEFADGNGTTGVDFKVAERVQIPAWIKTRMLNENPHCCWCGATLTRLTATIEHRTPLSKGGTNDQHNLALACSACNHERGDDASLPTTLSMKG